MTEPSFIDWERVGEKIPCECGRPARGLTCRCKCGECGSQNLRWISWGSYLDRDLVCMYCNHVQDIWDC